MMQAMTLGLREEIVARKGLPVWAPRSLVLFLGCAVFQLGFALAVSAKSLAHESQANDAAAFRTPTQAYALATDIMKLLAAREPERAMDTALRHSHRADPVVQDQLQSFATEIPGMLAQIQGELRWRRFDETAFATAFHRHTFELLGDTQTLRCMFTWRRGRGGWRLNQLLCA